MLISIKEMMELLCLVAEIRGMKAALKSSGYGPLMAGAGAFAGGLMGGLLGIAVGGAVGGLVGAKVSSGKFKPVSQIIMELSSVLQQLLYHKVYTIIRHLDWTDMASITALVMTDRSIQNHLVDVLENFFTKEIGAQIRYGR